MPTGTNGALLTSLRQNYLEALVSGSGRAADTVVETALDADLKAQQIYLDIFQPSAYDIGRLWQANRVSVAQEHVATAIIERQMGELYAYFKPRRSFKPRSSAKPPTIVLGCVPDEWHRVGVRMVSDFFEAAGWQVHYLGANVPVPALVGMVRETSADMVGLSAEMLFNLPRVSELVRSLDEVGLGGIPVIAGGMPFIEQPELWAALSLHGSAGDAAAAVATAERVLNLHQAKARPEPAAAAALRSYREELVLAATNRCLAAGDPADRALLQAGFSYAVRMLEATLNAGTPAPLSGQAAWATERQPHDGVSPEQLLSRCAHLYVVLGEIIPAVEAQQAQAYLDYLTRETAQRAGIEEE
ncbi:cobalamin B12-binding domain-containing protein [Candidatus Viridilinea mediisalina]|uniref:B12-binding domain-containing protein n=1 Tax=Candidatus Viridilinea mediisalina TaxID=2024553 RepID=A0A2A6RM92_9CHLR|nr:cobalamin-dependent protein [Candidatus Viridilinea mediisalina]PDW04045.1 hypothetical protein CJ255_05595 [Candidatus Viridilinea mediisalina]